MVKNLSKADLRKARKGSRRGSRKSASLARRAEKILEPGDLVEFNGIAHYNAADLKEGDRGVIVKSNPSSGAYHVLCQFGIVILHCKQITRVQAFKTLERIQEHGEDLDPKKL